MRGSKTVKRATKLIETLKCSGSVYDPDICNSIGCDPRRCMYHTAIARALSDDFKCGIADLHLTVRATGIKFHHRGWRWHAVLSKAMEVNIKQYDRAWKIWQKARIKNPDIEFSPPINPHSFSFLATRQTKIIPISRERQDKVNQNRRERIAAGKPDKKYHSMSERVVGM